MIGGLLPFLVPAWILKLQLLPGSRMGIDMWITFCYNKGRNRNKGVIMVVDESISTALNRIAENQEEMNDILKQILGHYNSVVPVMKRNADRVEEVQTDNRGALDKMYDTVFNN